MTTKKGQDTGRCTRNATVIYVDAYGEQTGVVAGYNYRSDNGNPESLILTDGQTIGLEQVRSARSR